MTRCSRALGALMLGLVLSGCVHVQPSELLATGETRTFTADRPPDKVFQRLMLGSRTCYRMLDTIDDGPLDGGGRRMHTATNFTSGASTGWIVDVMPGADGGSIVKVVVRKGWQHIEVAMQSWIRTEFTDCDLR